jgi:hypothetical protein
MFAWILIAAFFFWALLAQCSFQLFQGRLKDILAGFDAVRRRLPILVIKITLLNIFLVLYIKDEGRHLQSPLNRPGHLSIVR